MVREFPHRGLRAVRSHEQDPESVSTPGEWLHRDLQRELRQRLVATDRGQASGQRSASGSCRHAPRTAQHSSRAVDQQSAAAQDRGQCAEVSPATADHPEAAGSSLKIYSGSFPLTPRAEIARGFFMISKFAFPVPADFTLPTPFYPRPTRPRDLFLSWEGLTDAGFRRIVNAVLYSKSIRLL